MMKAFLVPDDLDSNHFSSLMISAPQNLAKGTFTERRDDLVSEHDMIAFNHLIVPALVVVAIIIHGIVAACQILVAALSNKVDLLVLQNLFPFIGAELILPVAKSGCRVPYQLSSFTSHQNHLHSASNPGVG